MFGDWGLVRLVLCVFCFGFGSLVARHTSHVKRHTSRITRHSHHLTRHTSHVTRHTSHVTRHASRITHHTSHITHHTSHVTRHTSPAPPSVNTVMRVSSRHRDSDMQSLYNARALALSDGTSNPQLKMRWPGKQRRMRPIMHNTTPVVIIQPKP